MTKNNLQTVPAASPYSDRIQSLRIERDFAPPSSPEFLWIEAQIEELVARAGRRADMNRNISISGNFNIDSA